MKTVFVTVSWILLSFATFSHAGLYPFADSKSGLYGYRDTATQTVLPPMYVIAWTFSQYNVAFAVDDAGWALIDLHGDVLLRPYVFDNGPDEFHDGLARFVHNGKIGFFNEKGEIVIPAQFDFAQPFSDGISAVCFGCTAQRDGEHTYHSGGTWTRIDAQGREVPGVR
ncbi:WG repeat-containing protein [Desulfovibrio inopinatus]|uniref:WG repeat-containing protein n=1 Tax=Desulfovibrio inopinatus TaxID=102109 RepID=UPI0003F7F629|nr:WG repeat-containing protein [Desulfovibrio inopinatus]